MIAVLGTAATQPRSLKRMMNRIATWARIDRLNSDDRWLLWGAASTMGADSTLENVKVGLWTRLGSLTADRPELQKVTKTRERQSTVGARRRQWWNAATSGGVIVLVVLRGIRFTFMCLVND